VDASAEPIKVEKAQISTTVRAIMITQVKIMITKMT
jgi:hypothetical protein